jgi:glycosyltransferase involved in cell wall biosynthesis
LFPNNNFIYYNKNHLKTNINTHKNANITDLNRNSNKINIYDSFPANFEKGRKFLDKCLEGILFNNNKDSLEINGNPIISLVIPVYKCEKTIKATIRSVQNQNVKNIEIILVNDLSPDNSLSIIQEMQKEDKRIKIINNTKNMGVLYSRSIGVLESKGKYIFTLDDDDMFFDTDILDLYHYAEDDNFDIIAFSAVDMYDYHSNEKMRVNMFHTKRNNLIVLQPELSIFPLKNRIFLNDPHIWGKCIKADLYKKAINELGKERYSVYNCWNEDLTIFFMICHFAKNYKFIRKLGVFHYVNLKTSTFTQSSFNLKNPSIILLELVFEYLTNNQKNIAALYAIQLKHFTLYRVTDKFLVARLASIIKRIINCQYVEEKYKEKIKKDYEKILQNES